MTKDIDALIPDSKVAEELGVTVRTLLRWAADPKLDFPPLVQVRKRNFRSRLAVEAFKRRVIQRAGRAA